MRTIPGLAIAIAQMSAIARAAAEPAQTNQIEERGELTKRPPSPAYERPRIYTTAERKSMGLPHQGERECARRVRHAVNRAFRESLCGMLNEHYRTNASFRALCDVAIAGATPLRSVSPAS